MLSKEHDLQKLIDHTPLYASLLDTDLNIVWMNKYASDANEDSIGLKCYNVFNMDEEQCTFCPVVRALSSKSTEVSIIEVASKSETEDRLYEITAVPVLNEEGIVTNVYEIRKDVTTDLIQEKKVQEKTNTKKNKEEVFSSNHLLDIVATELREYVDRAVELHGHMNVKKLSQEQKMHLSGLRIALMKSQNVLNNITIMRNINNGIMKQSRKKVVFKDLVTSKFTDYQNKAVVNGNSLDYKYDSEIPSKLIADKRKLELIVSNLIDYCVTNTANRYIQLTTSIVEELSDTIKLSLKIQNVGTIAIHDAIKKDADFFIRNNLALSVIKNLTLSLEGQFYLIPKSGYGIDMEVLMAFKKPFTTSKLPFFNKVKDDQKIIERVIINDEPVRKKILIAEDEPIGRITIEQMLKHEFDIILAKNGKVAVEKYFEENPDLVIMDIMMPVMNGFDAFDQIDRNCIKRVPIIACTAKVINSEKEYLKSYGFDDYLAKPVSIKALRTVLSRHLNT
ncbi:MAG: response regulator [Clostridia bacterium]|nr:response regulator [Clostridia bacterium]